LDCTALANALEPINPVPIVIAIPASGNDINIAMQPANETTVPIIIDIMNPNRIIDRLPLQLFRKLIAHDPRRLIVGKRLYVSALIILIAC